MERVRQTVRGVRLQRYSDREERKVIIMKKKIVFIVGSLRKKSFNRQLAEKCAEIIGERAEVSFLEYADMPFMNQDAENPVPKAVSRVREAVQDADGIWIFTPEYNAAIPGVLKNLFDWLSRPLVAGDFSSGTAVMGKKVTISGVGGKNATRSVRADLKKLLEFMRMEVIFGEGTGIALDGSAFANDVLSLSEESRAELAKQADAFLGAV